MSSAKNAVLILSGLFAATPELFAQKGCLPPQVRAVGQHLLITQAAPLESLVVVYTATNWSCTGGVCRDRGTVTRHRMAIDTRDKDNVFHVQAALGPKGVSQVKSAEVLWVKCR